MTLTKDEKAWLIAIMEDKIKHLDSSPPTKNALDKMEKKICKVEEDMKNKVGWKQFMWIVGTYVTISIIILGAIWSQTRANGEIIIDTQIGLANLTGVISNALE